MSLNLEDKKAVVSAVTEKLKNAETLVIAEYRGVTVDSITAIRSRARASSVYLHVLKNTLARRAVADTKFQPLAEKMSGQLIYGISDDPIAAAKVMHEFSVENDKVKIIAGMYNEELLDKAGVKKLALIPSREVLLSTVMGLMLEIPASFARCLAAIQAQKEQAA